MRSQAQTRTSCSNYPTINPLLIPFYPIPIHTFNAVSQRQSPNAEPALKGGRAEADTRRRTQQQEYLRTGTDNGARVQVQVCAEGVDYAYTRTSERWVFVSSR